VERKSPYRAIVAFSGEHEYGGAKVTEASLNGFPSSKIADEIREDPYRFLICADKFQTGYDEPLLHTMYVDKTLSGIKAVQTLSRLNRAHPKKHDVFVLDFMNDADTIEAAFSDYYRTTILAEETDPNKLHDLKSALDGHQVYSDAEIDELVTLYLGGAERDKLDPILDACVAVYKERLDEDGQVDFKGKAKAFTRTYGFLSSVLPYTNAEWEKLSIFLNFLVPKLPAPQEDDLSKGILQAIDMDSYRVEKQAVAKIQLPDADAEIDPVPTTGGGRTPEPELDRLSNIIKAFNDQFGNVPWTDTDRVEKLITEDIPARVAADTAYRSLVGMDRIAAQAAFSEFLGDRSLSPAQIRFVEMVIEQLTARGVMEASALYEPPFSNLHGEGPDALFEGKTEDRGDLRSVAGRQRRGVGGRRLRTPGRHGLRRRSCPLQILPVAHSRMVYGGRFHEVDLTVGSQATLSRRP